MTFKWHWPWQGLKLDQLYLYVLSLWRLGDWKYENHLNSANPDLRNHTWYQDYTNTTINVNLQKVDMGNLPCPITIILTGQPSPIRRGGAFWHMENECRKWFFPRFRQDSHKKIVPWTISANKDFSFNILGICLPCLALDWQWYMHKIWGTVTIATLTILTY